MNVMGKRQKEIINKSDEGQKAEVKPSQNLDVVHMIDRVKKKLIKRNK